MKGRHTVRIIDDGSMDRFLLKFPGHLRERMLKRALAKASRIMAREARRGAKRTKPSWGQPRGGRGREEPLHRSIRSKGLPNKGSRVVHRTRTTGKANIHAVAAEYGHEKVIFGERVGGTVTEKKFWRPAIDETRDSQHQAIIKSLKADLQNLANF